MFRLVDHTADLAIEATGPDAAATLADACLGLTAVLTGRDDVHHLGNPDQDVRFVLEAPDEAALVVAVLSELLWLFESEDLLWVGGGFELQRRGDVVRATATGNGVRFDPGRHGRGVEVKAVTFHGLGWGARPDGTWRLWVLLDI